MKPPSTTPRGSLTGIHIQLTRAQYSIRPHDGAWLRNSPIDFKSLPCDEVTKLSVKELIIIEKKEVVSVVKKGIKHKLKCWLAQKYGLHSSIIKLIVVKHLHIISLLITMGPICDATTI